MRQPARDSVAQAAVEWLGLMIAAALLVAALLGAAPGFAASVGGGIDRTVCRVVGEPCGGGTAVADRAPGAARIEPGIAAWGGSEAGRLRAKTFVAKGAQLPIVPIAGGDPSRCMNVGGAGDGAQVCIAPTGPGAAFCQESPLLGGQLECKSTGVPLVGTTVECADEPTNLDVRVRLCGFVSDDGSRKVLLECTETVRVGGVATEGTCLNGNAKPAPGLDRSVKPDDCFGRTEPSSIERVDGSPDYSQSIVTLCADAGGAVAICTFTDIYPGTGITDTGDPIPYGLRPVRTDYNCGTASMVAGADERLGMTCDEAVGHDVRCSLAGRALDCAVFDDESGRPTYHHCRDPNKRLAQDTVPITSAPPVKPCAFETPDGQCPAPRLDPGELCAQLLRLDPLTSQGRKPLAKPGTFGLPAVTAIALARALQNAMSSQDQAGTTVAPVTQAGTCPLGDASAAPDADATVASGIAAAGAVAQLLGSDGQPLATFVDGAVANDPSGPGDLTAIPGNALDNLQSALGDQAPPHLNLVVTQADPGAGLSYDPATNTWTIGSDNAGKRWAYRLAPRSLAASPAQARPVIMRVRNGQRTEARVTPASAINTDHDHRNDPSWLDPFSSALVADVVNQAAAAEQSVNVDVVVDGDRFTPAFPLLVPAAGGGAPTIVVDVGNPYRVPVAELLAVNGMSPAEARAFELATARRFLATSAIQHQRPPNPGGGLPLLGALTRVPLPFSPDRNSARHDRFWAKLGKRMESGQIDLQTQAGIAAFKAAVVASAAEAHIEVGGRNLERWSKDVSQWLAASPSPGCRVPSVRPKSPGASGASVGSASGSSPATCFSARSASGP